MADTRRLTESGLERRGWIAIIAGSGVFGGLGSAGFQAAMDGHTWGAVVLAVCVVVFVGIMGYLLRYRRRLVAQAAADPQGAEERWQAAADLAAGDEDNGVAVRLAETRWVRITSVVIGAIGVLLTAGLVIGILVLVPDGSPMWLFGMSATGVGFLMIAITCVLMFVGPFKVDRAWWPGAPLNMAERMSATNQIRGKEPVDPDHVLALRGIARFQLRSDRLTIPMVIGFVLMGGGQVLAAPDSWLIWTLLLGALFVVLGALIGVQSVRARRFLARTADWADAA
jgi:hypothetical protein